MPSIPQPLPLSYLERARALSTAEITVRDLDAGGIEQRIVHGPLVGVTREMLFWWMHHIGDEVTWEGHRVMAYRLWHPRDHIDWSCDGPVRAGCRFHIVEAFGAQRRFLVDNVFHVPRLDPSGFRIETRFFGAARASIDEGWDDLPDGVRWTNTMRLEPVRALLGPLVRLGARLKRDMLAAWQAHNVEEVGFVPEFLPQLYASRTDLRG
jgi:hypothetical protein